jgi:SAM-dependent methyltransferase
MTCAVCTAGGLRLHLRVRSEGGRAAMIPTTDAYGMALDDIVRCGACGHMQLAHTPTSDELLPLYEEAEADHYIAEEAGQRVTARLALDLIEAHVAPGRMADLGCWVGFLLAEARERGWEVTGVEPSAYASAFARERLGLPVQRTDLFAADLPAGAFDAVVLGDVIEHLPDPGAALERIGSLLRDGGVVYLALPDAGSRVARRLGRRWWSVIPTHVQYFTRESAVTLLRRHGFEPLHVGTAPKTFSVGYYAWRLTGYSSSAARWLERLVALLRVAERQWAPDFHDRMAIVARRVSSR